MPAADSTRRVRLPAGRGRRRSSAAWVFPAGLLLLATACAQNLTDEQFLDEIQRRNWRFFVEQWSPITGQYADRARADGSNRFEVASIAATGFGLAGLCIAQDRGWIGRDEAYRRALTTLRFLWHDMPHERGWFYHFVDMRTGARAWACELSSIDTGLLLAGALVVRQHFEGTEVERLATAIYQRVDFPWMTGGGDLLRMGWTPEDGFLEAEWRNYSEHLVLQLMGLGSPTHPLPPESWERWERQPVIAYGGLQFLACPPLFAHQFSHAFVDFRGKRDRHADYWHNSVLATRAHRQMCVEELSAEFPHYGEDLWGITASDHESGYTAWGGPPRTANIDGTVVPCAAGGAIPMLPGPAIRTLRYMREQYGDLVWRRYGFVDAFNPATGWTGPDVIGIDKGITLLMIENHRTGRIWNLFMDNPEIRRAMGIAGFTASEPDDPDRTSSLYAAEPAALRTGR